MESNESFKALYTISFLLPSEYENCEKHIETILCIALVLDFFLNVFIRKFRIFYGKIMYF